MVRRVWRIQELLIVKALITKVLTSHSRKELNWKCNELSLEERRKNKNEGTNVVSE